MCVANPAVSPVSGHSAIFNASSHPAVSGTWRELMFSKCHQQSCGFTMAPPCHLPLIRTHMKPYGARHRWSSPHTLPDATALYAVRGSAAQRW